ncbi:MAG: hypothetical protein ACLFVT_08820 [Syntrophobacteria bacterium]
MRIVLLSDEYPPRIFTGAGVHVDYLELFSSTPFQPRNPKKFSRDLAAAINDLLASPGRMQAMGADGPRRVERCFSWNSAARQTLDYYRQVKKAANQGERIE